MCDVCDVCDECVCMCVMRVYLPASGVAEVARYVSGLVGSVSARYAESLFGDVEAAHAVDHLVQQRLQYSIVTRNQHETTRDDTRQHDNTT